MNLTNFIKSNEEARKIFGKRELEIIQKQLSGINLTQSEKNRLSRDIRKKLEFIKDISRFSEEFKLKKGAHIKAKINEVKKEILGSKYLPKIESIILFGSTIANYRTVNSDIDIAVKFRDISKKEAFDFRTEFNYDKDIDVQVYNILPDKIKLDIDKYGRTIWKR